jgi:hypothetical protein
MLVVRATKKFLDRVASPEANKSSSTGFLGDWYANVLFWRPQVALFVNVSTLLPVIVPLAPSKSVVERFPAQFASVARRFGVAGAALEKELDQMQVWVLHRTASRSVLGTTNHLSDIADRYRWAHDEIDLTDRAVYAAGGRP